jgi:Putative auto-transporter adhesin, head GIN domain
MLRFASALALLVASLGAFALAACGVSVETDGSHTVQTRSVASFQRLEVHGSANVVVRRGTSRTLTVEGGKHRVHDLITRVDSGTLVVETRDSSATIDLGGGDVTVTVQTPSLNGVRIDGSGDVTAPDLAARRLAVQVNGSGDVHGAGRVDTLDAAVDGSGDLHLADLVAQDARVDIAGSGDANVHAERTLHVAVHGSGDVKYSGTPRLTKRVEGSGDVSRRS